VNPPRTTPPGLGPAVLAFGGNALLPDPFHPEDSEERARDLARSVLLFLEGASGVVLVHGNGPQVGTILLRVEATRDRLPPEPLDVLVAETQGSIGVLLARALHNAVREEGVEASVTAVLTQVVVDPADPAFGTPTKPVGPYYGPDEAERARIELGWQFDDTDGRGRRRLVPSPRPLAIVELGAIGASARAGAVVIAGGGGGVPVRRDADGRIAGVEAVVDKDRTAALLATSLDASRFVILTGVPHVARGFGTPAEERLDRLTVAEARELLARGEFPAGSMGPKVEAACDYAETAGRAALITSTTSLIAALDGRAGTWVTPQRDSTRDPSPTSSLG
jgi:carbamate kinase